MTTDEVLQALKLDPVSTGEGDITSISAVDGTVLGRVASADAAAIEQAVGAACAAFESWRCRPPPARGELVRLFGEELRRHKGALGRLVTLETGKILSEGLGEVQEMIDICDFAVGLSRQIYGLTIASERPGHRLAETWHPIGPIGVITAFNFPVAVWSWNTAIALVCGNSVVWKPSDKAPLTALACQALLRRACARHGAAPANLCMLVQGGPSAALALADDRRLPVVSATGSTAMGKVLAPRIAARLGRAILELGGNNAMIVAPSADLDMAVRAILFGAVGTCGQRCTSLRRVFVHSSLRGRLLDRLRAAYTSIPVGDPLDPETLVGPIISAEAAERMAMALAAADADGADIFGGDAVTDGVPAGGHYVRPALVALSEQNDLVRTETFAPILYVMPYETLEEAIAANNDVRQGLSSCIFTRDLLEAERFLSAVGSDCGLANVNIGPSGAEIGGAFGGEKDTGGGRESGTDAWKAYMRRQTQTINASAELPLAQGVVFEVPGAD